MLMCVYAMLMCVYAIYVVNELFCMHSAMKRKENHISLQVL